MEIQTVSIYRIQLMCLLSFFSSRSYFPRPHYFSYVISFAKKSGHLSHSISLILKSILYILIWGVIEKHKQTKTGRESSGQKRGREAYLRNIL